jgi:hypothetical protein
MELRKMTYKELERKLLANRQILRTADRQTARKLINENHSIMVEMDRRLALSEKKLLNSLKK